MNYWDYRKKLERVIPRITQLLNSKEVFEQKQKGRKSNYHQFNLEANKFEKKERLLDKENIKSSVEVSLRAQSCPMPLNLDVWDGSKCPYGCKYCYADYFKESLYSSFFDNHKEIGIRYTEPDILISELSDKLDKSFNYFGNDPVLNSLKLRIPIRLGIRFEDFTKLELKKGVSLKVLEYLKSINYPVMINTKSNILEHDSYLKALSGNKSGSAVHITLISSNESLLKRIEPGAPTLQERVNSMKILTDNGVRVVARIEPWMLFVNDKKEEVDSYIELLKYAGVKHITFDSYSYSAKAFSIKQKYKSANLDWERMFLLSSDSQIISSFMLGKFMEYFIANGFYVNTFDSGNVNLNSDWICCSVGDLFEKTGSKFNYGSGTIAIKYIQSKKGVEVGWGEFDNFVKSYGCWLSDSIRSQVKEIWNATGDKAWPIYWAQGLEAVGQDNEGLIWKYNENYDKRKKIIEGVF